MYGVQEATPQLVVESPTAVVARAEGMQRHHVMGMALEASNLSTIYVFVSAGER